MAASLVRQGSERIRALVAYGASRHQLKPKGFGTSTGLIHSTATKNTYHQVTVDYLNWVRETTGLRHLTEVDAQATELVPRYLIDRRDTGASPFSLPTYRSALRLLHGDRELAADLVLPRRRRHAIRNSRGEGIARDGFDFTPYADLVAFLAATGLRRKEVRHLRVKHVEVAEDGSVVVHVRNGKGGRIRAVVPLGDHAPIRALVAGRPRDALVFAPQPGRDMAYIPQPLRTHVLRRRFAQACYLERSGIKSLPPSDRRLLPGDYDIAAVRYVSEQLGHSRTDVVLTHYLRDWPFLPNAPKR